MMRIADARRLISVLDSRPDQGHPSLDGIGFPAYARPILEQYTAEVRDLEIRTSEDSLGARIGGLGCSTTMGGLAGAFAGYVLDSAVVGAVTGMIS